MFTAGKFIAKLHATTLDNQTQYRTNFPIRVRWRSRPILFLPPSPAGRRWISILSLSLFFSFLAATALFSLLVFLFFFALFTRPRAIYQAKYMSSILDSRGRGISFGRVVTFAKTALLLVTRNPEWCISSFYCKSMSGDEGNSFSR